MILALLLATTSSAATAERSACAVTAQSKADNSKLDFEAFDQQGSLPSSARALVNRECWAAAAEVTQDYLIHGPVGTDHQQRILVFHLAQQLANAGREDRAALVVASARHPDERLAADTDLRWNDFVQAHWAFLTKDRPGLVSARTAMGGGTGFGNRLNSALVDGLLKCFDKPYLVAVSASCRATVQEDPK